MIYWINFVLYLISIAVQMTTASLFLTPKYTKRKSLLLYILSILPTGIIKFFVTVGSLLESVLAVVNMVVIVAAGCALFKEKLKGNIIAMGFTVLIGTFAELLCTVVMPENVLIDYNSINATLFYVYIILVFIMTAAVFRKSIYILAEKHMNNGLIISFILIETVYYIIMSFFVPEFYLHVSVEHRTIASIITFLIIAIMFFATYILLRKNEEQNQMERIHELEIVWESESAQYEILLSKMGQMERIRHDFYGQLAAARHIMTLDRERGIEMIEELRERLLQEKESDILD